MRASSQHEIERPMVVGSRILLVLLVVAVLGAPLGAAWGAQRSSDELEDELGTTEREREATEEQLGEVRGALAEAEEELAVITARLEDARGQLVAAQGQVALAEAALEEAEDERDRADQAYTDARTLLAAAEDELEAEEQLLVEHLVHTFKYGSSGAQAGAMTLEVLRRAEDPNAFMTAMKSLETVIDVQDGTVRRVFELRDAREDRAQDAAAARAAALQAEDEAAETLTVVEELREEAATLTAEIETDEAAQQQLVSQLEEDAATYETVLTRVEARADELSAELREARAAEEAERLATAPSGGGSGRLGTPGADGGPGMGQIACPVQGAVAGRDFSNDWGYPRSGGRYHQGNDIFAPRGTPVVAVDDATIVRWNPPSSQTGLGGITVTYRTADGSEWYNAHLASVAAGITPGAQVARGQPIGSVGNSGNARTTPPHLHLGRRAGGSWVNPWPTISPVC